MDILLPLIPRSLLALILIAALYGVSMKLADLFNEHGLKPWFRGSSLLCGVLCGIFGSLLIYSRPDVANIILAMILGFLVRMRVDYRNHAIALCIMVIAFVSLGNVFIPGLFFFFFIPFVLFGALKDYFGDIRPKKDWLYFVNESAWYYVVVPVVYGLITNSWAPLLVLLGYVVSYTLVKVLFLPYDHGHPSSTYSQ